MTGLALAAALAAVSLAGCSPRDWLASGQDDIDDRSDNVRAVDEMQPGRSRTLDDNSVPFETDGSRFAGQIDEPRSLSTSQGSGGGSAEPIAGVKPPAATPSRPANESPRPGFEADPSAAETIADTTETAADRQSLAGRSAADQAPAEPSPANQSAAEPSRTEPSAVELSPAELLVAIDDADRRTATIFARRSDTAPDAAANRRDLFAALRDKYRFARRLADHVDATEPQVVAARRSELQASSGLASLGDPDAASRLTGLASSAADVTLDGSSFAIKARSRLADDGVAVLLQLQLAGIASADENALRRTVELSDRLISSRRAAIAAGDDTPGDAMASLVALGRVRETLQQYGHEQPAADIRTAILNLYAESADDRIARAAAATAGNLDYDEIDSLLDQLIAGDDVPIEAWREAVQTLIDRAPDLQTVQYLAPASMQLASMGRSDHAEVIDQSLDDRFTDPASAARREIELAAAARQARRDVIGRKFRPDYDAISGDPIDMRDYLGRTVIVPFWMTRASESLALMPAAEQLANEHNDVAIVGINLDANSTDLSAADWVHPSYIVPTTAAGNPAAAGFGIVSLPAAAVIDPDGRVASIAFTPETLRQQVETIRASQ